VPQWIFSCNWIDPQAWKKTKDLIQWAGKHQHPYTLTTNYENISLQDLPLFQRAEYVTVSLDEYKVNGYALGEFIRILESAHRHGVHLKIAVTLTEAMLIKLIYGRYLTLLSPYAETIYLVLPKSPDRQWIPATFLQEFLRFYHEQIIHYDFYQKVELDHCLKSRLSPWREIQGTECAYQQVLTLMPDGLAKICPYARAGVLLRTPEDILPILQEPGRFQEKAHSRCLVPVQSKPEKEHVCHAG
jgi:hypothetical protein